MGKLRPLGLVTNDLEPLLEELIDSHEMQTHEILGVVYLWITTHRPDAIETYLDGSRPNLLYGNFSPIKKGDKK